MTHLATGRGMRHANWIGPRTARERHRSESSRERRFATFAPGEPTISGVVAAVVALWLLADRRADRVDPIAGGQIAPPNCAR